VKPSQTDRTLAYSSCQPKEMSRGLLRGEIKRSLDVCTLQIDREIEAERIRIKFFKNGYPIKLINDELRRWKPAATLQKSIKPEYEKWIGLPYIPGLYEKAQRWFASLKIGTYCKSSDSVRGLLCNPWNNPTNPFDRRGLVYAIPCTNCTDLYIGQTGRCLNERLNEHKRAVRNKTLSNAVARHAAENNHEIGFANTKTIWKEKNPHLRLGLEAFSIAANADRCMNISPPTRSIVDWLTLFKDVLPDVL